MNINVYQADAFVANGLPNKQSLLGNPAGVCLLESAAPEEWMKGVAREMGLSETAFLAPIEDGYHLRWFTPAAEVALCGHATLASAHILWERGVLARGETARFHTLSGLLTARQNDGRIWLDFPVKPVEPTEAPAELADSLGVRPLFVGKSAYDYLVEVDNDTIVRQARPDIARLKRQPVRGTILTSRSSDPAFDFVSRFFAPALGVDEDPVTGSAHCCLAHYWATRQGKNEFNAYQAPARGGLLRVILQGERVLLGGQALTAQTRSFQL